MSHCPVCQTEYTEVEASRCFACNWDLTPCPEAFVEKQNVHIAWAREIWIKFQALQQQLPTSINAEIDASPQLSQLREESNLDAWNLLVSWVSTVNLNAANAAVIRLQERYQHKQPREIAHILIVQKSCQAAGVDLVRGIPGAAAILKGLAKVNLPTIAKLSAEMIYQIAAIYGVDLQDSERQLEVLAAFGAALLGEQAIEAGIDWLKCGIIPGKVISAGAKGLMIYAIGKAACLFYETKVNQHVNPLISRELFDELREESQDYLENATSEDAIAELISVEIETTPIKIPPPKPVKKPKVQHRTSGGAAALRGYFVLPELMEQGMQQRLGRGSIKNVMPLNNELVVVCSTGGAALFNLSSGEALWEIDSPGECSAVSSDGTLLAFGWKEDVYLWDLCTGQLLWQLRGHTDKVINVAISADGRLLASSGYDETTRLWDIVNGREVQQLIGYNSGLYNFAFSPDGKLVASFIEDGNPGRTVQLWDVTTGMEVQELYGHESFVYSVAFSPDGKLVASASSDTIRLWDVASGTEVGQRQGYQWSRSNITFSPNGKLFTLGNSAHIVIVRLCDIASDTEVRQLQGHRNSVCSVAFTPDSKLLVSGSHDETVRLWDVASGIQVQQLQQSHTNSVQSVAFSPDSKLLASGGEVVRLWDVSNGREVQQFQTDTSWVESFAFSPDGLLFASGSFCDNTVWIWNVTTGTEVRQLQGHLGSVRSVAFSADGKLMASGSSDNTVCLWDVASGRKVRQFQGHTKSVESVVFTLDSKLLVSGGDDGTVRLWDVFTGREVRQLQGYYVGCGSIALSPDGSLLLLGTCDETGDKTLRVWNIASEREVQQLHGHTGFLNSLAFSPDGKLLASAGSCGGVVRLWNVASGQEVWQLQGHTKWVESVVFSPDGKLIATACGDGVVRLWKVEI